MRVLYAPLLKSLLVALALGALLCLFGGGRRCLAQTVDETGRPDSMLVYAADLEIHPERYARADQILVFGMESDRNIGRFRVSKGVHHFCLEGGAGFFTQIVLLTDRGSAWPVTAAGDGCVRAELPAGVISVLLQHGDGARPGTGVTATVRMDPPLGASALSTPLVDAKNSPIGGYWLVADTKLNGRGTLGLAIEELVYPSSAGYFLMSPIAHTLDETFLLGFPPADGSYRSATIPPPETYLGLFDDSPYVIPTICPGGTCPQSQSVYGSSSTRLELKDLGSYLFQLGGAFKNQHYNVASFLFDVLTGLVREGDTFQVLFRYYADGSRVGELRPGEVAVYDQCDFKGRAAVLVPLLGPGQVSPPFDLRLLSSSWWALNGTLRSIRVGKGAGAYWGTDPENVNGGVIQDTACLSQSPENNLYVEPESNVLSIANSVLPKACIGCDFSGVPLGDSAGPIDFRQWDLTGAVFAGTDMNNVDFSGATLTNAKFTNASLNYVRFPGVQGAAGSIDLSGALLYKDTFGAAAPGQFVFNNAHLCGTSLHGAGPDQRLDLTIGPFANALVQMGGDCATDLSGNATDPSYSTFNLDVAALAERGLNWGSVNLTGAAVLSPAGTVLSSTQARLLLGKVQLTGTALNGVVLDYAKGLAGKDLTGIQLVGSTLRHVDLQSARLYDADLEGSNLEQANLQNAYLTHPPLSMSGGAQLDGAYLFNVNLSGAQLSGADFTGASFYGAVSAQTSCKLNPDGTTQNCATAAGATMYDTKFNGAYLYGVDFSGATMQGVDFSQAFLVGANLGTATVSDSSNLHTNFYQAYLQGANFSGTTFTAAASFEGAFFDFTANTIIYPLPNHTEFAGYWGKAKEPVCVRMPYNALTTGQIPTLVGDSVCPGGPSPRGCGDPGSSHWNSDASLPTSFTYTTKPTYSQPAPPTCTPDFEWNFGLGQTQRPETQPGERR